MWGVGIAFIKKEILEDYFMTSGASSKEWDTKMISAS